MLRGGARSRAALREPSRALPCALRARLDAVLRGRHRRRDRRPRGERGRGSEARRRHDSQRRRRAGLGARCRLARGRRGRSGTATPLELGGEDVARTMPVERCFDWESLALLELAAGDVEAADAYASRAEEDAALLPLQLPAALARRARAAVLLARASRRRQLASRTPPTRPPAGGSTSAGCILASAWKDRPSRRRESDSRRSRRSATRSTSSTRAARRGCETRCAASSAVSARGPSRAGRPPGESGVASLSKRELEIAELATDRMTNREIAAALFLSDKTIESHLRNIFHKLGVTSRVEVARAVERERPGRGHAGVTASRRRRSRRRAPGGARLPTGAGARAASLRQRRDGLRRHLARRRPLRGGARRPGRGRSGVGVGAAGRAGRASACCWRCTRSWRRSSRSPAARTSGAAG